MKKIIKKHIKSLAVITFLLIICNLLSTLHPYVMKQILDIDFSKSSIEKTILMFIIVYTSIHIILAIFKNVKNIVVNKTMTKLLADIREKLFDKVLNFKMSTFNKYNSSGLYTRLTVDVYKLSINRSCNNIYNCFSDI